MKVNKEGNDLVTITKELWDELTNERPRRKEHVRFRIRPRFKINLKFENA